MRRDLDSTAGQEYRHSLAGCGVSALDGDRRSGCTDIRPEWPGATPFLALAVGVGLVQASDVQTQAAMGDLRKPFLGTYKSLEHDAVLCPPVQDKQT